MLHKKNFEAFAMRTFNVIAFCSVRNTARFWVCFVLMIIKKKTIGFFSMLNFAVEVQFKM